MILQCETRINIEGSVISAVGFSVLVFFFKGCEFSASKSNMLLTLEAFAHFQQILYNMDNDMHYVLPPVMIQSYPKDSFKVE